MLAGFVTCFISLMLTLLHCLHVQGTQVWEKERKTDLDSDMFNVVSIFQMKYTDTSKESHNIKIFEVKLGLLYVELEIIR